MDYSLAFAAYPGTWDRVVNNVEMSGEELRRAIVLFNAFMSETENRYLQFRLGYIHAETWNARQGTLVDIKQKQVYGQWRQSYGGRNHSPEFLQMLDNLA